MKDNALRRCVKFAVMALYTGTLWTVRALLRLGGRRPFRLGGQCGMCAKCCENPGIQVGVATWSIPPLRAAFLWWQRVVNGFVQNGEIARHRVFLFDCTHFDRVTRRCDSYSSRPVMCRDYPRNQLWQPLPRLLEGCGYRPVHPRAPELLARLRAEGLEGEKLEQVKDKMFLRE